ncbi:peptidase M24 [Epithele typhae]|uniref:peptidase M24 n=1 Tax=Epithele typhae TaxID=378194 RepID=UPI00200798CD|nr:peptidase M24 [Epithele typhae]KAH9945979.1 peptidase M24 [Epithele typhae]
MLGLPGSCKDFSHLATHCADVSPIAADSFVERQDALARTLHALGAAAYVAEPGANAGFFANLTGSLWHLSERPLLLVIQPQTDGLGSIHANVSILTPTFEKTRAMLLPLPSASSVTYTAWPEDSDPYAQALALIPNLEEAIIYVDGGIRMFIADSLQKAAPQAHVTIAPAELRQLRERKSAEELEIMKYVNEVTVLAIRAARDHMYIGMRESEAMSLVVSALSTAGLKDTSALTLFGENAALPHGSGTDRVLGKTDFILIDTGGVLHGYESDVTRTFALPQSEISAEKLKLWNIVHMAQARALETAKNGTVTAEVDREARKVISDAGYGKYFTHRLGHGIGMEVHESPYLRGGTEDVILTGNSFSDEPGIYIEGEVGVRLEDCFYIDDDGVAQYLTQGVGGAASGPWTP